MRLKCATTAVFHCYLRRLKKTFTAERVEQLRQLSRTPDIYERLARALGWFDKHHH